MGHPESQNQKTGGPYKVKGGPPAQPGGKAGKWSPWGCHVYIDGVDLGDLEDIFPELVGPTAIALATPNGQINLPQGQMPAKLSCGVAFLEGASDALDNVSLPGPKAAPVGGSTEDLTSTAARAATNQYIVEKGLVVPLRSSIFRGMNFVADVTEVVPLAQGAVGLGGGDIALFKAKFVNHTCQMP